MLLRSLRGMLIDSVRLMGCPKMNRKTIDTLIMTQYNSMATKCELQGKIPLNLSYEDAVNDLNDLQCKQMLNRSEKMDGKGLQLMRQLLCRAGVTDDDMTQMNVIHITGTKGKGSTCALVEGILRENDVKTGFFNSPHLVEVRERLRVDGKPLSKDLFAKYYWETKQALEGNQQKYSIGMPSYFYFLTTLAYYVFKHENVEAAIMEVGIGGAYDATNVIRKPAVCGIATLDIDHVSILGDTVDKIAWQKAGIMKAGVRAFTIPQPVGGMDVLQQRAKELGACLSVASPLDQYETDSELHISMAGKHQKINASLAVEICKEWISKCLPNTKTANNKYLDDKFIRGLAIGKLNGRSHKVQYGDNVSFYLDGAHTCQSIKCASEWFVNESHKDDKLLGNQKCRKVLVYNVTHKRDSKPLLEVLYDCGFDEAVFLPNIATLSTDGVADQNNFSTTYEDQISVALENNEIWKEVCESRQHIESKTFVCVSDFLETLSQPNNDEHIQIFVIGSFHLVGAFLGIIQPNLND